ncbi:NACHT and WD repeat domain-containing protein 2-like [Mizuhopecten yessoensis]|uniref:AAA+ ATPase domain-containing protein n=1 Tax=Mizuhopecten yessoensis TaxID=6573 RepID=A0A210QJ82_MIZYE|nr:NACHT and WD repeat domain-containing protein 2-like [Mizuhopecten yessoensis]OWF48845.1 hypothetical protein KP79_PYT08767 [Mizuhopecten yessoensis]
MSALTDPNALEILSGMFPQGRVPNIPARVVRVFLAASGPDTIAERNVIIQRVYPELREYCRNRHGVEFQMIDLDWGIPPSNLNIDNTLPDFKLRELQRCQRSSAGPNFVALIGQKYGDRLLHSSIPAEEFDTLRMSLHNHKGRETRNAPILDTWYARDDNSIAPVYVLRPIGDIIPEYKEDGDRHSEGVSKWFEVKTEMRRLFRKAADYCYLEGQITKETKDKYSMSELDSHIHQGIEESDNPLNKCTLILRNIVDLKNYLDDPKAKTFAEVVYNEKYEQFELETESTQMLTKMKEDAASMVSPNVLSYDVLWRYDDVISPELHKDYLDQLYSEFSILMKELVDRSVPTTVYDFQSDIVEETMYHWLRCQDIARTFCGREEEYGLLTEYLLGTFNQPVAVFGPPGSSKTSLLSKVAMETQEIVPGEVISVIRYVGFTPRSADLKQLLSGICTQILASLKRDTSEVPHDFKDLQKFFLALVKTIPSHVTLVLFLDSVDNILPDYSAHFMSWMPNLLNRNVKIVVSTHPEKNQILSAMKQEIIRNDKALVEMKPLSIEDAERMLVFFLGQYGRRITATQMEVFKTAMNNCSLPMYVSLCAEHAKMLRSSDDISLKTLPTSIHEAIHLLLNGLEISYGVHFVSKAMAYLVASVTGLSDCEVEDLLSLDEDVMSSLYTDHHPFLRRLPSLKWLRLKDDIRRFLIVREVDGVTACCFRQEEFNTVIKEKYLSSKETAKQVHSMIADYFLGTWHGKPKPIVPLTSTGDQKLTKDFGKEANRYVPTQPLTFFYGNSTVRFNRRKYDQVPRHLYLADRLKELNQLVLFNYEWMYNKIKALSLQHIMADFALNPGVEATLVEEALRVAGSVIERDINNLSPEITGHLLPYYSKMANIRALLCQCDTDGLKHCALIPNFPYLQVPGSSLICTLDTSITGEFFQLFQDDRILLIKQRDSSHIHVYDMAVGEKKKSIFTSNGALHTTPDGRYFVIVDHVTEKAIKIHNSSTGDFVGQLIVLNHITLKPKEKYKMGDISITNDRICLVVTTDSSYLCIADIESCHFLQIISLDGRSDLCRITPNGKFVFCNSNEFLLGYDLYSLEHTCTFSLGSRPNSMTFSKDGFRGYLSSVFETKLLVMHLHRGTVEMAYKTVLEEEMPDDTIMQLKISPNDDTVLIRGLNTILVYSRFNEKVIARFSRPKDIPKEFKLPKSHFIDLFFTAAEYTRDGKFVIGTIFRNIYLWQISTGNQVTSIQAPVGIITELLVSTKRSQIVTHIQGASNIQLWNIDEAVNQVNMLDRLTGPITAVRVTGDSSIAYVMCKSSDEIGVIDMRNGSMLDLLTHDSPVSDFAITPTGSYVLVSTLSKKLNMATKLWDMTERRIIKEFGNTTGYCISANNDAYMMFVAQEQHNFKAPFSITLFRFVGDTFHEYTHPLALKYILGKPFLTNDDKYLVVLTAQDYVQLTASYDTPIICTFAMEEDMRVSYFTPESFQGTANVSKIVDVKPCPKNPYTIAIMYESNRSLDINENATTNGFPKMSHGLLILDICSGSMIAMCDPFMTNSVSIETGLVYSNDFQFCLDVNSSYFDISQCCYRGKLPNPGVRPSLTALNDSVVVYYNECVLYVVRVSDGKQIAKCNVHAKVCHLHLCKNDRTFIVGCSDGTIASYVLIDPDHEVPTDVIQTLRSRQIDLTDDVDGRLSRSWDKIESGGHSPQSRPTSGMIGAGPKDKILLKRVKPVPKVRPNSDTFMYLNSNSKSCSIM